MLSMELSKLAGKVTTLNALSDVRRFQLKTAPSKQCTIFGVIQLCDIGAAGSADAINKWQGPYTKKIRETVKKTQQ